MESNNENNEVLSVETLSEETKSALQALFPNLTNGIIASVAFFTSDNKIYVHRSYTVEQPAASLTLTQNEAESIIYYTTYETLECTAVRCCANRVVSSNGVVTSHTQLFGDANSVFTYDGKYYYFSYNPNESTNKHCCVYYAIQVVDSNGELVWEPAGPALFCGKY